ncbi:hypothetical protein JHK84_043303 [Glycine max]|uniref:Uncharacterized protein n=1 Tax=Glycine soja TaxID=3848 RepID=A0A445GWF7_GLYSO|nr:hypothetical protein JHK86_043115 [Glycine max]KAG5117190.1 hypothetical protein JHK84_043303 [Glycine max]RZB65554.1 hypothetical protein D0Y65_041574 [Glycine soja]
MTMAMMKVLCDSYYKDGSYKEEEIPDSLPQQEPSLPNKEVAKSLRSYDLLCWFVIYGAGKMSKKGEKGR